MRFVSIDPGVTTGLCYYQCWNGKDHWKFEQIGPQPHHNELYLKLKAEEPAVVIIEDFKHVGRESVLFAPVEYIGVARLYTQKFEIPLQLQTPGAPKRFWDNTKLRKLGLFLPGQKHAMDALRHALYYLAFVRKDERWLNALR